MTWLPKKKVVVPVDFSDKSFTALDTAIELVSEPKQVLVVHVLQELSPLEPAEMWHTIDAQNRIRHTLTALRERLGDKYKDVDAQVLLGDPGHEVTEVAEHENADLIVLTSHGRTGVKRLLIGSVAERVTRLAHCPVLVLRD